MKHEHTHEYLKRVTEICLAMPGARCETTAHHVAFVTGRKTFAYFLDNHHGDEIVGIACKVLPGDNATLIAANAAKFYMPAYVGSRGWVGPRLDLNRVDWSEVRELVGHSYGLVAPSRRRTPVNTKNRRS